jgi:hypothetical protein
MHKVQHVSAKNKKEGKTKYMQSSRHSISSMMMEDESVDHVTVHIGYVS